MKKTNRNPKLPIGRDQPGGEMIQLTCAQRKMCSFIAGPLSYKEIAQKMLCSENTVKWHMHRIFEKFKVKTRPEFLARLGHFEISVRWVPNEIAIGTGFFSSNSH